jgi:hypothetical protein
VNGGSILTLATSDWPGLVGWLLSFGRTVTVVSPAHLRASLASASAEIAAHHSSEKQARVPGHRVVSTRLYGIHMDRSRLVGATVLLITPNGGARVNQSVMDVSTVLLMLVGGVRCVGKSGSVADDR